ncbi:hypothetical protein [Actinomyces slackii]|uniref:Uncharacterized protein n=1 Tax=Actinomyces slackii TaxID=52774 RepID=A0A448KDS3_9ACTO|nr:hypothetical protein [Actinomyces slackii]VEG75086.1 Uncharacterised protein [Actinomyces slackii]
MSEAAVRAVPIEPIEPAEPVRRAGSLGAPSSSRERLAAARLALARAEERTGLRADGARQVERALAGAAPAVLAPAPPRLIPGPPGVPRGGGEHAPTGPWEGLRTESCGAVSLAGSTSLLLAAAAARQGSHGWCGVVGGEDLGWCAAVELGLDVSRVLVVPAGALEPRLLLAATGALLDGVDLLLVTARTASALRPRDRRLLTARARERGALILTPAPWEGARTLRATLLEADGGVRATGAGAPGPAGAGMTGEAVGDGGAEPMPLAPAPEGARTAQAGDPQATGPGQRRGGVVVALHSRQVRHGGGAGSSREQGSASTGRAGAPRGAGPAQEMPSGFLTRLTWALADPERGQGISTLSLGEEGLSLQAPALDPASAPGRGQETGGAGMESQPHPRALTEAG